MQIRLLCMLVSLSLALICPGKRLSAAEALPNILVILADDLGYSDLGCYGGEIATPHLDQLARDGLRFTQFYNTARCWPSRAALLTGYYAQQVRRDAFPGLPDGAGGNRGQRPAWAKLLPEMLQQKGYRNYHSGKWHVDSTPLRTGFDRSYLLQDQSRFFSPQVHFLNDEKLPAVPRGTPYYATTIVADHAIKCLQEHHGSHRGQPFFQYVAFAAPHFPLHALPEDIARYKGKYAAGWDVIRKQRWERLQAEQLFSGELSDVEYEIGPPYHFPEHLLILGEGEVNRPVPWDELTPEQQQFQAMKMELHAAMIDRMDREIGRILAQLKRMNVFENTLILMLSDNGASAEIMVRGDGHDPTAEPGSEATYLCLGPGWSTCANTPLRRHKTWTHEGGIATPFIAHWPAGIATRGDIRHQPAHLIDLVPTLLELTRLNWQPAELTPPGPEFPGRSLLPLLTGQSTSETALDSPQQERTFWWSHEANHALRRGPWKAVQSGEDAAWELYNLEQDRTERHNLAAEHSPILEELRQEWLQLRNIFYTQATGNAAP